jgi:excinuclease ABC subunit A
VTFDGVVEAILMQQDEEAPVESQRWARQFIKTEVCPDCQGARLKKESLYYRIHGKNIAELSAMDILELNAWLMELDPFLEEKQRLIATEIVKEIQSRLQFLLDVGLDYLSLNRASMTLSGGESQRIRLLPRSVPSWSTCCIFWMSQYRAASGG